MVACRSTTQPTSRATGSTSTAALCTFQDQGPRPGRGRWCSSASSSVTTPPGATRSRCRVPRPIYGVDGHRRGLVLRFQVSGRPGDLQCCRGSPVSDYRPLLPVALRRVGPRPSAARSATCGTRTATATPARSRTRSTGAQPLTPAGSTSTRASPTIRSRSSLTAALQRWGPGHRAGQGGPRLLAHPDRVPHPDVGLHRPGQRAGASCADLVGQEINKVTSASPTRRGPRRRRPVAGGITASDCAGSSAIARPTRLDLTEQCDFGPLLEPGAPTLNCGRAVTKTALGGLRGRAGRLDPGRGGRHTPAPGVPWEASASAPGGHAGGVAYGPGPDVGHSARRTRMTCRRATG